MLTKYGKLFSVRASKIALVKIKWDHSEEKREEGQQVIICLPSILSKPQFSPVSYHTGLFFFLN